MIQSMFEKVYLEPNSSAGFSAADLSYWQKPELFKTLISDLPQLKNVKQRITARSDFQFRQQITEILIKQYSGFEPTSTAFRQIEKLKNKNSFTVICAHQPCLMGGPLYWIYKIASTIKLASELKIEFPEYEFIPVYFSGNEDHDFLEINHFNLFHHKISWDEKAGAAMGRLPTNKLIPVLEELEHLFERNQFALDFIKKNKDWVLRSNNYGEYFRHFVNDLFGHAGLLYFNPDDTDAKNLFSPVIKKELTENFIYTNAIANNIVFEKLNLTLQVNPRELNLFYHHDDGRKRITKKDGQYNLVDSTTYWNENEMQQELDNHILKFSPNVLLRPLYQEFIFPNVAFVGGGAEIAYWMQLRTSFEAVKLPYPLLFRRFSAVYFDQSVQQKISKTIFSPEQFILPIEKLEALFVEQYKDTVEITDDDWKSIKALFDKIKNASNSVEASSKSSIESELQKMNKSLEHIENKFIKAIKFKYELDIQKIQKIKSSLFPENKLQERHESFLSIYLKYGSSYIDFLITVYQPNQSNFVLIKEL